MIIIKYLGKSKKIKDSKRAFCTLCYIDKYKVYDNYFLIREQFIDKINIKKYEIYNDKPESFFKECDILIPKTDEYNDFTQDDLEIHNCGIKAFELIYKHISNRYNVQLFKVMRGLLGIDTKVYMYIEEENAVIVNSELSSEDILNLLSINGINVYVYNFEPHFRSGSLHLYNISINKASFKLLTKELEDRKKSIKLVEQKIKKISPSYPKKDYFSLEDTEHATMVYNSFSKDCKRALESFLLNTNGEEAFQLVRDYRKLLDTLTKDILVVDLLMQSYRNIIYYNESNVEKLTKDKENYLNESLMNLSYRTKFLEYKILMKDFNKRYRTFHKWFKKWHSVVKNNTNIISCVPNEDGQHYKIAQELADKLSKLWFISEVILFGSTSRGQEGEGSDIDIIFKVGIDLSELTIARRETLYRVVEYEAIKIEENYEELCESQLNKKYGENSDWKFYAKTKLFDILAIQYQKKKYLKLYEDAGFLDNSITLFKKDDFIINYNDSIRTINFKDIDYVLLPTNGLHSFIINKEWETDEDIFLEYIKFNYIDDIYGVEYIARQIVNKQSGFRFYHSTISFPNDSSNIYSSYEREREESMIDCDIRKGGIRKVNPNVNYIEELYRWWM